MLKLNLGCGTNYRFGYINSDKNQAVKADQHFDARKLPYTDNSVNEILATHLLEHFDDPTEVLKEWHRALKPDGILKIEVPYAFSHYAFVDPSHKSFYTWNSFAYFANASRHAYYNDFGFTVTKQRFVTFSKLPPLKALCALASRIPHFYERFLRFALPIADGIYVELKKEAKK